jgi:FAD-dependent urate hydroxylase
MSTCDIAIVGAGPYGLSSAAHLSAAGLDVRVFGEPMQFWAKGMPEGMLLRSPRVASTISDPQSAFTLEAYEEASQTEPVKRVTWETFVSYGKWFEQRLSVKADQRGVVEVQRDGRGFALKLADGSTFSCKRLIIAAGIGPFRKNPKEFAELPPSRASHCYEGRKLTELGKRVAIIGAGQSALECAAILRELGADVEVIARIPTLRWIGMHQRLHQMGPLSKMLYSKHDIGPIGISRLVAYPKLMYHVPMGVKDKIRKRAIRSAGAPWLIPRLKGVKISTARSVNSAREIDGEVQLMLNDGSERRVDHVLMGTGYRVDIGRYSFLPRDLVKDIRQLDGFPDVGPGFTTSVPGLHFIGATSARKFGPLVCFVTGTEWSSTELTSWICENHTSSGSY